MSSTPIENFLATVLNLFTITDRINSELSLAGRKNQLNLSWNPTFIYILGRMTSLGLTIWSTCLTRSFVLTRCCIPTYVMKIVMRHMSNVQASRRFPIPDVNSTLLVVLILVACLVLSCELIIAERTALRRHPANPSGPALWVMCRER